MTFKDQIRNLENIIRSLDDQIFQLEKSGNNDKDKINTLIEKKYMCQTELRKLNKLQWDAEHETVNLDDDR